MGKCVLRTLRAATSAEKVTPERRTDVDILHDYNKGHSAGIPTSKAQPLTVSTVERSSAKRWGNATVRPYWDLPTKNSPITSYQVHAQQLASDVKRSNNPLFRLLLKPKQCQRGSYLALQLLLPETPLGGGQHIVYFLAHFLVAAFHLFFSLFAV